ncbi:sugar transferase [Qipengyuania gelatinilytica]|uniref:Sugar transferase n=1 Tax=Qipengyuania gelatinilytica TaxID=2867231 RepID=A0ABX9A5Y6_9SPHN|nr:sugar transferase [Qipengyuania gelatinilytica]QZD95734.1 sugar transferase [Qipengyuania gelatinilytica]
MQRLLAIILLVGLSPLLGILGLITRMSQGSPVLFRQLRSGRGGKPFRIAKFRSMTDRRDANGELLPDDERVTAWGRFLRRSRLDELPGLWSIARGDMAFVGPRPLLPETIASLGERGKQRGKVRPGLTGWAQVNGNTLLSLDEKIALDLDYVSNPSLGRDLVIITRTFWVMIGGERRTSAAGRAKPDLSQHR